jgi:hypothetical protein
MEILKSNMLTDFNGLNYSIKRYNILNKALDIYAPIRTASHLLTTRNLLLKNLTASYCHFYAATV